MLNKKQNRFLQKLLLSGSYYRIITDEFLGYEVQIKRRFLFWNWWEQCHMNGCINTHRSIEDAKKWIKAGCPQMKPYEIVELVELEEVVWESGNDQ